MRTVRGNLSLLISATRPATALSAICFALTMFTAQAAAAQSFNVIHTFTGASDGAYPTAGVTVAATGNLYGTASGGGTYGKGAAFQMAYRGSGWTLSPLHEFAGGFQDGAIPFGGLAFHGGILYGTTSTGGLGGNDGGGVIYELSPPPTVCKTATCYYNETILYEFPASNTGGDAPYYMTPVFDQFGNMYGTTEGSASSPECPPTGPDCGTAWELTPSNGGWTESIIYNFTNGNDGRQPLAGLIIDAGGNLYGVAGFGSGGGGTIIELSPSNGGWIENTLYDFVPSQNGARIGANDVAMDSSGNLYGALGSGGPGGSGTVYELTPTGGGWTFSLLWAFPNGSGGCANPFSGVTLQGGNLYGTCAEGGAYGYGEVFQLSYNDGMWELADLHDFTNGSDGGSPEGNVVFDANGNMFGTALAGGNLSACSGGCGTIWEITGLNDRK